MSQEDRFARESPRQGSGRNNEYSSSSEILKRRQQRHSVIRAERSPYQDFTQTPFGNDDMFNACFDDYEEEKNDYQHSSQREDVLSRTYANNSQSWLPDYRKHSFDMPTQNGKLVRATKTIETGIHDPFETDFPSLFPRRNSEFFNEAHWLTRSYQTELFSRYPMRYGSSPRETGKYVKWSSRHDLEFTKLSNIYPTRLV